MYAAPPGYFSPSAAMPPGSFYTTAAAPALPAVRGRNRKIAKRALCPFINTKIIEVANRGDVPALIRTVSEYLPEMNLVNLTTALHRLAKLCSERAEAKVQLRHELHQQVLQDLLANISTALLKSDASLTDSRRQALSNIIWSLGTLKCVQLQLVQITVALAEGQLGLFKPFELVSTVWAFAKLGSLHPQVREVVAPLQSAAVAPLAASLGKLGLRFLAMTAWALMASGQCNDQLFSRLATRIVAMMRDRDCSPEMLVDLVAAFSSAGIRNEKILTDVAVKASCSIGNFDAFELADMCQTLSSEHVCCPEFFEAAARQCDRVAMPQAQLTTILTTVAWARSQVHRAQISPTPSSFTAARLAPPQHDNRFAMPSRQESVACPWGACGVSASAQEASHALYVGMKNEAQRATGSTTFCEDGGASASDATSDWSEDGDTSGNSGGSPEVVAQVGIRDGANFPQTQELGNNFRQLSENDICLGFNQFSENDICRDFRQLCENGLGQNFRQLSETVGATPSLTVGPSPSLTRYNIKNTFLELEDDESPAEGEDEEDAVHKRLDPPLVIALASFPRDELDTLRVRYQKSRDL